MGEYYDFGGLSMNVKSDEERKSKVLKVRLNDKEFAKLKQYTEESGLRSMSEYIFNSMFDCRTGIFRMTGLLCSFADFRLTERTEPVL